VAAAATVPEVIARMRAIETAGRSSDGVVCFTRLYLRVTEAVNAELASESFADPTFLERLDVVFANLFFDALDANGRDPAGTPPAWAPLFAARSRGGIAPLQFALAGMNAHINRDLPVALVATCEELELTPRSGSPEHADYLRINDLLERVEGQVKAELLTGGIRVLDRLLHRFDRIDDVVAMWDVRRARDAAWTNAGTLWSLRGEPLLRDEFMDTLDRMVGFAGRGLLVPADSLLGRIAHTLGR
jgi:hypothetical protein